MTLLKEKFLSLSVYYMKIYSTLNCSNYFSNIVICTLQLLETMMKNCGDYVHFQVIERDILQEMIKIVKKKVCFRPSSTGTLHIYSSECENCMFSSGI